MFTPIQDWPLESERTGRMTPVEEGGGEGRVGVVGGVLGDEMAVEAVGLVVEYCRREGTLVPT